MEHLIANYLFQTNNCPLPGIGTLQILEQPAKVSVGAKFIEAPQPMVTLTDDGLAQDDFLRYISFVQQTDMAIAQEMLNDFCSKLQSLDSFAEKKIPAAGKFYVNQEGELIFKPISLPAYYVSGITAEKVIHPDSSHNLLVGDKESNTALMTEYFNVEASQPRKKWWIAAALLAVAGIMLIFIYYADEGRSAMFGNTIKPRIQEVPQTYTTPK